jgi:hypothetical protein
MMVNNNPIQGSLSSIKTGKYENMTIPHVPATKEHHTANTNLTQSIASTQGSLSPRHAVADSRHIGSLTSDHYPISHQEQIDPITLQNTLLNKNIKPATTDQPVHKKAKKGKISFAPTREEIIFSKKTGKFVDKLTKNT